MQFYGSKTTDYSVGFEVRQGGLVTFLVAPSEKGWVCFFWLGAPEVIYKRKCRIYATAGAPCEIMDDLWDNIYTLGLIARMRSSLDPSGIYEKFGKKHKKVFKHLLEDKQLEELLTKIQPQIAQDEETKPTEATRS